MKKDHIDKQKKASFTSHYSFDTRAGFPFVKPAKLTEEEETALAKDAMENSDFFEFETED